MHEPLPSLRRLFALRQFTTFSSVDLTELAVIADNVRELRFEPGAEVAPADTRLGALQLVLEGRIEARHGSTVDTWGPRDVFGFLEVLARRAIVAPAISPVETHTLQLRAHDTLEILEDNFTVLTAVIRGLAMKLLGVGGLPASIALAESEQHLTLVERVIVLRQQLPFAGSRIQALAALAQGCEEVSWPAGTKIASQHQLADAVTIVLAGTLHSTRPGRAAQVLRAGHAIGALESLAAIRHHADVETTSLVKAIRFPATTVVDVLEDHADLGLAMVTNLARALLDAPSGREVEHDLHSHLS